jgi:hypothetical protein
MNFFSNETIKLDRCSDLTRSPWFLGKGIVPLFETSNSKC